MSGRCLYLVSSSANREYVADCLEALALPRGMVHHFRYRRQYVDERLWDSLPTRSGRLPKKLKELPVVVVYMFQEQSRGSWTAVSASDSLGAYVPIRCGNLIDAFQDGRVAHFYFLVSEYVKKNVGRFPVREVIGKRIRFKRTSGKTAERSYAHIGANLNIAAPRRDDTLAFQDFVDHAYKPSEWRTRTLGSAPLDVTYDLVFFRITGLFHERDGHMSPLSAVLRSSPGYPIAEYNLDSGTTYHLGINTYLLARRASELPGQGTAQLRLKFDAMMFREAGSTSLRISSPYDLEYWALQPLALAGNQRTMLTVVCEHSVSIDRDNFVRRELLCPEVTLPVLVRNSSAEGRDGH